MYYYLYIKYLRAFIRRINNKKREREKKLLAQIEVYLYK